MAGDNRKLDAGTIKLWLQADPTPVDCDFKPVIVEGTLDVDEQGFMAMAQAGLRVLSIEETSWP